MSERIKRIVEDWMQPWQKEVILNEKSVWKKEKFKASDGYWIKTKGAKLLGKVEDIKDLHEEAIVEKLSWDHEHCRLCWEKIAEYEGCQHEGYTNGKDWVCEKCYKEYIAE